MTAEGAAQAAEAGDPGFARPFAQWFERPTWRPAPPLATAAPPAREDACVLLCDGEQVGDALAACLRERGADLAIVRPGPRFERDADGWRVRCAEEADYVRLLAALAAEGRPPARVVSTWTAREDPCALPLPETAAERALERCLFAPLAIARAMAPVRHTLELVLVTAGALALDGVQTRDPLAATVAGPCRVIPAELPQVECRHVDVDAVDAADACALADELERGSSRVVALRSGARWTPAFVPLPDGGVKARAVWRERGAYLITGGLDGLGLVLAEHLGRTCRARLALLSRRGLPAQAADDPREEARRLRARAAIARIEVAGGTVHAFAADVADRAALGRVRERVRDSLGPLDGIVHAAGVSGGGLRDGTIDARTRAAVDGVLGPKVHGTLALDAVFGDDPFELLVLYSSVSSFHGGIGQLDYCAANAFLDAYARAPQRTKRRVVAVNWAGWLETGMWAASAGGRPGIRNAEGIRALERVLASGSGPQVVVSPVPAAMLATVRRPAVGPHAPRAGAAGAAATPTAPTVVARLAQLWGELLGLAPVAPDADFFALGGSSLTAVELIWRIADELGCTVRMRTLASAPTPALLAAAIARGDDAGDDCSSPARA